MLNLFLSHFDHSEHFDTSGFGFTHSSTHSITGSGGLRMELMMVVKGHDNLFMKISNANSYQFIDTDTAY